MEKEWSISFRGNLEAEGRATAAQNAHKEYKRGRSFKALTHKLVGIHIRMLRENIISVIDSEELVTGTSSD